LEGEENGGFTKSVAKKCNILEICIQKCNTFLDIFRVFLGQKGVFLAVFGVFLAVFGTFRPFFENFVTMLHFFPFKNSFGKNNKISLYRVYEKNSVTV